MKTMYRVRFGVRIFESVRVLGFKVQIPPHAATFVLPKPMTEDKYNQLAGTVDSLKALLRSEGADFIADRLFTTAEIIEPSIKIIP
jgi:hypothetical protein